MNEIIKRSKQIYLKRGRKMENEKIIIQSKNSYRKGLRVLLILNLLIIVVYLILYFMFFSHYEEIHERWLRSQSLEQERLYPIMNTYKVCIYIGTIAMIILVIVLIFYFYIAKTKMIITNRRVYGKAIFGTKVSIPLSSISAVEIIRFKGLAVATSSGKIMFRGISNRDDMHKVLSILVQRQKPNNTAIQRNNTEVLKESGAAIFLLIMGAIFIAMGCIVTLLLFIEALSLWSIEEFEGGLILLGVALGVLVSFLTIASVLIGISEIINYQTRTIWEIRNSGQLK